MDEFKVMVTLIVLVIISMIGAIFLIDRSTCHSGWARSGFQTSWGPVQGCLISKDGKTWIPSKNYRDQE